MLRYDEAIARLERAVTFGINPSLDGIRALTDALGRPQDAFQCVQITGTNGKTSVARMTGALMTKAGRRTAVYTSPHLNSYTERFEIDGVPASEADLAEALSTVFEAAESLDMTFTEFELLTAAAFELFRAQRVEWAVLEVGMGGRWDATSVVVPVVAVITGIGLDHTDRLGATREEIAADKAHIIKQGSRVVIGPGCDGVLDIFERRAESMRSPIVGHVGVGPEPEMTWQIVRRSRFPGGTLTLDVTVHGVITYRVTLRAPSFQAPNAATAMAAAGAALLEVGPPDLVNEVMNSMTFPGRCEMLRMDPPFMIDGAHNPQAAEVLAEAIAESGGGRRPAILLAILADKDAEGIVRALAPVAGTFVVSENGSARCMPAADLADVVEGVTGSRPLVEPDLTRAIEIAGRWNEGAVATGSLYTAGAVRALLRR